jgi:basic membrane protein A and related proteins
VIDRRAKIGLVLPAGIDDPYDQGPYLGIERAVRELDVKGRVLTPTPKEGYAPSFLFLARQKYDLVVVPGVEVADALDAVALKFPDQMFAIIGADHGALPHRPRNVQGIAFREEEAGFLAGQVAVLALDLGPGDRVVSAVGGEPVPGVQKFIAGYEAGARAVDPNMTTLRGYTNDFFDPLKGRSVALGQIAQGSRVVFQVAGACGLGALEAAKEQGVWGIGVDVDQSHLGPHVLTSALIRMDVAVFDTIERFVGGTLETGGTSVFSLRNGGVGLGSFSPEVPHSVVAEIERVTDEIVAGTISIPTTVT